MSAFEDNAIDNDAKKVGGAVTAAGGGVGSKATQCPSDEIIAKSKPSEPGPTITFFRVDDDIGYAQYVDESMLPDIMGLVSKDLSEPYSIFTYRYFLMNWPSLCTCVYKINKETGAREEMIAVIVSKADTDRAASEVNRGYIAMVAVNKDFRKRGIASSLVNINIENMMRLGATEATLEAEIVNRGALGLYEKLGFFRDEMLGRYYLNGSDAYKLRLNLDKLFICKSCDAATPIKDRSGPVENSVLYSICKLCKEKDTIGRWS